MNARTITFGVECVIMAWLFRWTVVAISVLAVLAMIGWIFKLSTQRIKILLALLLCLWLAVILLSFVALGISVVVDVAHKKDGLMNLVVGSIMVVFMSIYGTIFGSSSWEKKTALSKSQSSIKGEHS